MASENKLTIAIPSYKRPAAVAGYKYFDSAVIVVPESQAKEYAENYFRRRIVAIPDAADGNIARKRNWILKNMPRPVLMLDDDVEGLTTTEGEYDKRGRFLGRSNQNIKLSPAQAMAVIENGFNLAHQWGCALWGLNVNTDGLNYQQYKPLSISSIVLGPFQGHLRHGLLYDERMGTKDDYDFSIQVLNKYRKILRINKYAYQCKHGGNAGGIVSQRTMEVESGYCRAIEKKWGRGVISYPLFPKKMAVPVERERQHSLSRVFDGR